MREGDDVSDDDDNICANCGWPAENCGLTYLADGSLAHPYQFDYYEVHVAPGCQVCYDLQTLGNHNLLRRLAARRRQIDAYRSLFVNIYKAADEAHRRLLAGEGDVQ